MQIKKQLIFILIFFLFILNSGFVFAQEKNNSLAPHKAGELLVKLKNSSKIYKFKFSDDISLKKLIKFYSSQPDVEYVEPNYIYHASLIPNDEFYYKQNYLEKTNAQRAWNISTSNPNVVIAVIDSGVDIDHPDLKNNIWTNKKEISNNKIDDDENGFTDDVHGWDFIDNTNNPRPKLIKGYSPLAINHGTVVAGIADAQGDNQIGIAGVAWHAKIMPIKVLDEQGVGDTQTVARAIDYARKMGADIINLSFVGSGKSLTLETAIKNANAEGILIVAAAGNEISSGINMDIIPAYPVCHDGSHGENWVIGVASVDQYDHLASFSNYGKKCIDISAPGVALLSTVFYQKDSKNFNKQYKSGWTGTSVSAPQVSGALALIKAIQPNLSARQIKNALLNNTINIEGVNKNYQGLMGRGELNVFGAVSKSLLEKPRQNLKLSKIISTPALNGGPYIRIFKKKYVENQFFAYDEKFKNSLSIASADLDGDSKKDIVIGMGKGIYPWIKIFTQNGVLKHQFLAFDENMQDGVEVSVGDVNGDGKFEIIASYDSQPLVRVFNQNGILQHEFYAFDKKIPIGVETAVGDVNGDGKDEIIVAKKSGYSEVKIFDSSGLIISSFMAFSLDFNKGVHLAVGDFGNDGQTEVVVGAGHGSPPIVRYFDYNGRKKNEFLAYNKNFKGGVYVAVGDVDDDKKLEIITGAGPGGGPHIRVFNKQGQVKMQFFAYAKSFRGGVRVATEK